MASPTNLEIDTGNHHLPVYEYCFQNMETFHDLISGRSKTDATFSPSNPCIIDDTEVVTLTYSILSLKTEQVGMGLSVLSGVSQGDVVMLLLPNSEHLVFAFLGLTGLGAVSAMANPLDEPAEVHRKARAVGVKVVITMESYVEKVRALAEEDGVRVVYIEEDVRDTPKFQNHQDGTTVSAVRWYFGGVVNFSNYNNHVSWPTSIQPDDVVAITYSSSGSPTNITHRDLVSSIAKYTDGGSGNPNLYFHANDVVLCALPLFQMYSLISVLCAIRVGAAIVMMPKFGITHMLKQMRKHKVTVAPLMPAILQAIVKSPVVDAFDLSSVRTVLLGETSTPVEKKLEDIVRGKLPNARFSQGYQAMIEFVPFTMDLADFSNDPFEIEMRELKIDVPKTACVEGDEIEGDSVTVHEESASASQIPAIPLAELKRLTGHFSGKAFVGNGAYGKIYQATLSSGQRAAIWILDYLHNFRKFYKDGVVYAKQLSILARINHNSWADLLGYCLEADTLILVYPFPTNGSLAEALYGKEEGYADHGLISTWAHRVKNTLYGMEEDGPTQEPGPVLTWAQRVKIACSVAKGLEYLHEKADPPIVHGDFGTRNVLLFDDYDAKITSSFTLTSTELNKALPDVKKGVLVVPEYHAPEYYNWAILTSKSDVYSYGVLLLELIFGKKVIDPNRPGEEESLVSWAQPMLNEDVLMQHVDPKLNGEFPPRGVARMAAIADLCLQEDAAFRPNMTIVFKALKPLLDY